MNSTSILEQFVTKGKGVTMQGRVLSIIIITIILMVGVIVYAALSSDMLALGANTLASDIDPVYHLREGYASEIVVPQADPVFFLREGYAAWDESVQIDPVFHLREGYAAWDDAVQIDPVFHLREGYAAWTK